MCVYDGEGTKYNIIITFLNFAYACLTARFDIRFLHTHTHQYFMVKDYKRDKG